MPKFSIIVPVYNSEKTLDHCVQSILKQQYKDFELLLVNDGSTDNSLAICEKYSLTDNRVQVFNKINGGVSSARNLGINNAQGCWITFCDSDDWVNDNWLSNFITDIDNVDIVCQGMNCNHSQNILSLRLYSVLGIDFCGTKEELLFELYKDASIGYIVTKCFRNDIIQEKKLRFDERFNCYEDEEFVLRYLLYCNNAFSRTSVGYNYNCPYFEQKYIIKHNILKLSLSMFQSAKSIYSSHMNDVLYHYLEFYTMRLVEDFVRSHKIEDLKQYRRNVGKMIFKTNLFKLTQWVIYFDRSCIFSYIVLFIHSVVKKRLINRILI